MKKKTSILSIIVAASALVIAILFLHIGDASELNVQQYTDYINEEVIEWEDGIEGQSFQIDLSDEESDYALLIRSSQQMFRVIVGEEVIYEYDLSDSQLLGEAPPSKWHLVDFTEEQLGEVITIEYYTPYSAYEKYIPTIYYGDDSELVAYPTVVTFPACVLAWITIVLGLVTIFICSIYQYESIKHINYLGIFLVMFGLWSWGDAKSMLFNYTDLFLQSQITSVLCILIPVPVMLYVRNGVTQEKHLCIIRWYIRACYGSAILGVTLAVTGVLDLIEYFPVTQVMLVAAVVVFVYISTEAMKVEITNGQKKLLNYGFAVVVFGAVFLTIKGTAEGSLQLVSLLIKASALLFTLWFYTIELMRVREKQEEEEKEKAEIEEELHKANVHLMTDKMTPHFMHNTLLAIQELCYSEPIEAANAIGTFSRYIRINLEGIGDEQLVPFEKELEYLKLYMSIQQLCYEDDIVFDMDIQEQNFYVPPLSIQPIIENAVVHGIRKCRKQGIIKLKAWREEDNICISVEDNGAGFNINQKQREEFSSSIAIAYRIEKVLNGEVEIQSNVGEGTIVNVRFPRPNKEVEY